MMPIIPSSSLRADRSRFGEEVLPIKIKQLPQQSFFWKSTLSTGFLFSRQKLAYMWVTQMAASWPRQTDDGSRPCNTQSFHSRYIRKGMLRAVRGSLNVDDLGGTWRCGRPAKHRYSNAWVDQMTAESQRAHPETKERYGKRRRKKSRRCAVQNHCIADHLPGSLRKSMGDFPTILPAVAEYRYFSDGNIWHSRRTKRKVIQAPEHTWKRGILCRRRIYPKRYLCCPAIKCIPQWSDYAQRRRKFNL